MSEIVKLGNCPKCGQLDNFVFSGSGKNATCMKCKYIIEKMEDII
jgi:ribosomal protein S27E